MPISLYYTISFLSWPSRLSIIFKNIRPRNKASQTRDLIFKALAISSKRKIVGLCMVCQLLRKHCCKAWQSYSSRSCNKTTMQMPVLMWQRIINLYSCLNHSMEAFTYIQRIRFYPSSLAAPTLQSRLNTFYMAMNANAEY